MNAMLPFWIIGAPLLLAVFDLMRTGKSTVTRFDRTPRPMEVPVQAQGMA